jgi:hypothetical protein
VKFTHLLRDREISVNSHTYMTGMMTQGLIVQTFQTNTNNIHLLFYISKNKIITFTVQILNVISLPYQTNVICIQQFKFDEKTIKLVHNYKIRENNLRSMLSKLHFETNSLIQYLL